MIGWEDRLRNDLFCVEWDVELCAVLGAETLAFCAVLSNVVCFLSVDTPDETDKSLPEDDLQKNLAFLLDRVEGCSVTHLLL